MILLDEHGWKWNFRQIHRIDWFDGQIGWTYNIESRCELAFEQAPTGRVWARKRSGRARSGKGGGLDLIDLHFSLFSHLSGQLFAPSFTREPIPWPMVDNKKSQYSSFMSMRIPFYSSYHTVPAVSKFAFPPSPPMRMAERFLIIIVARFWLLLSRNSFSGDVIDKKDRLLSI